MNPELIPLDRAASLLGISLDAYRKRCQRDRTLLFPDSEDHRRKRVRVADLPPDARQQFYRAEAQAALEPLGPEPPESTAAPFQLTPYSHLAAQHERRAVPPVPTHLMGYYEKWVGITSECSNNTWKRFRHTKLQGIEVNSRKAFIHAKAKEHRVSVSNIYSKLRAFHDADGDLLRFWQAIRPQPRPGRSKKSFFCRRENNWMSGRLEVYYLNQARLSVKRAHELLLAEIDAKQKSNGLEHPYAKPTLHQSRTYLSQINKAAITLAREGEKAYNDRCAPYISRRNNLRSNQLWVTDQKLYDVRLRDGGERIGRVWGVNVLDVASWRWLGFAIGPYLSSDLVMEAYARALERAGVPGKIHFDRGKEFDNKRFGFPGTRFDGRFFFISETSLLSESDALWERLGVGSVRASGRCPQSKTIERWHREIDRWTRELPGWCGASPDERPEILAVQEAEHAAWLKTGRGRSPLLRIGDFIARFVAWADLEWNVRHRSRGKYLRGMTPNEAWNTRLPPEALRKLTTDQVDYYTAERRFVKVARGGQINLTFYGFTVEYIAPELFNLQGEKVEVLIARKNPRQVTVIYPVAGGTASCPAGLKPQHDWLPEDREELRLALRCRAAARRALKRGIEAGHALDESETPLETVQFTPARAFGAERRQLPPRREKPRFANERTNAVLAILDGEEAQ